MTTGKSQPKSEKGVIKGMPQKNTVTHYRRIKKAQMLPQTKSEMRKASNSLVLLDIDGERDIIQSMSQAIVSMIPEAPIEKDNFSEAPLVPRRLQFSESLYSPHTPEELKMPEAPNILLRALGKALFLLVARYAGVD